MLKHLLSIAAIAAISLSAKAGKTVDILDNFGSSGWSSEYTSDTHTITYTGTWSGRGWWLGGADYSAYESIVIKLAKPLEDYAQIVVEYSNSDYSNSTSGKSAGATEIECPFDKDGRAAVAQIYLQSSIACDIVLSEAYLVLEDTGATEKVLFEGEEALSWYPGYEIDKSNIITQGAGSKLVIDVDFPVTEESDTWSLKLGIKWTNDVLPSFKKETNFQEAYNTIYTSSNTYTYTFTEEDITALKNDGDNSLRICGESTTKLKKVTLVYPTADKGSVGDVAVDESAAPVEYFNLQGVRVANPQNGLYIRRQGTKATKVLVK
jgi:hypothetical protein